MATGIEISPKPFQRCLSVAFWYRRSRSFQRLFIGQALQKQRFTSDNGFGGLFELRRKPPRTSLPETASRRLPSDQNGSEGKQVVRICDRLVPARATYMLLFPSPCRASLGRRRWQLIHSTQRQPTAVHFARPKSVSLPARGDEDVRRLQVAMNNAL